MSFDTALRNVTRRADAFPEEARAPARPSSDRVASKGAAMSVDVMTDRQQAIIPVQELLGQVLTRDASDLHLTAGAPPTLRIHGSLRPLEGYQPLAPEQVQQMVYAMLTQRQRERLEEDLELDL